MSAPIALNLLGARSPIVQAANGLRNGFNNASASKLTAIRTHLFIRTFISSPDPGLSAKLSDSSSATQTSKNQTKKKYKRGQLLQIDGTKGSLNDFGETVTGKGERSGNDRTEDVIHLYKHTPNKVHATLSKRMQRDKSRKRHAELEQLKYSQFEPEIKRITGLSMQSLGVGNVPGFLQRLEPTSLYQPRSRFRNRRERTVQSFTHHIKSVRDREDNESELKPPQEDADKYEGFRSYLPNDVLEERKKKDRFEWTEDTDFLTHPEAELEIEGAGDRGLPEKLRLPMPREQTLDSAGRSHGKGGRKTSFAEAWAKPGIGQININNRTLQSYFPQMNEREAVLQPLLITGTVGQFDIQCKVRGGGITGQAGAVRMAIANAIQYYDPDYRPPLKFAGYLERDNRQVERKKPGQAGARKRFQWSKR